MNTTLPLTEEEILRRAKHRVGLKTGFMTHALAYLLVNLGLAALNLYTGGERWHYFPLFGWGLGLAIHGIVTWIALRGEGYRERMLANEVARVRNSQ